MREGNEEEHEEEQTESKGYTNRKCVLEELFDRAGHEIVTFIPKAGSEALLNDESLDFSLTKAGISRSQMENTEGRARKERLLAPPSCWDGSNKDFAMSISYNSARIIIKWST